MFLHSRFHVLEKNDAACAGFETIPTPSEKSLRKLFLTRHLFAAKIAVRFEIGIAGN